MSVIEVDSLLTEISAEAPGGADVEYDPEYFELEKMARGTPATEIGDAKKEAEEPEWKDVKAAALKMFERTRDLRVANILATSLLKEDGIAGFHDGVGVIKGLIEKMWEQLFPKLDPDDNNDPTIRVNILKGFAGDAPDADSEADLFKTKLRLREAVLTNSQQKIGRFGYRDIQIAKGEVPPPAAKDGAPPPPDMKLIDAAFEDTATEFLVDEQTAIQETIDTVKGIDSTLNEKLAGAEGPNFASLLDMLGSLKEVVDGQLAKRGIGDAPAPADDGGGAADSGGGDAPAARSGGAISGEISSRNDVIRMLDKINEYYERYEPTSPVPVFMNRAKRLVTMNFIDLIKDLAPEAISKIEVFTGQPADGAAPPSE